MVCIRLEPALPEHREEGIGPKESKVSSGLQVSGATRVYGIFHLKCAFDCPENSDLRVAGQRQADAVEQTRMFQMPGSLPRELGQGPGQHR